MKHTLIGIFVAFGIICHVSSFDYCTLNPKHIACGNSGNFVNTCPSDARIEKLSMDNIQTLLKSHNDYRNSFAGGNTPGFKSASKMLVLQWDSELASLAELNVKQCAMIHDTSRSTDKYRSAGQNLYWSGASGDFGDVNLVLKAAVTKWFNEYKFASQSDVDKCCGGSKFLSIGHFLQLVQDRAEAIGCAVSRYTENDMKKTLIACNYSFGNLMDTPVYSSGAPASACPKGKNVTYKNLCN